MDLVTIYNKYASLLSNYCLNVKSGERILVRATYLAEPLLQSLYPILIKAGAIVEFQLTFEDQDRLFLENANNSQLDMVPESYLNAVGNYDSILTILSAFNLNALKDMPSGKLKRRQNAMASVKKTFMKRSSKGDLKWALCLFPTPSSAKASGMSLTAYRDFVFQACGLYAKNPSNSWKELSKIQQELVDELNTYSTFQYKSPLADITFSTKNRLWINSDGKRNMPSGEVFSSPVENSVEGTITFDYPTLYEGALLKHITLEVKRGKIVKWDAKRGKSTLDRLFDIDGARFFGEVAIGTNYNIKKPTKNILFDEKIGGTVHMAIGASYPETGGKNQSAVHLDFISNMSEGRIFADNATIYQNGQFLKNKLMKLNAIF
ncbi:aminopeptidase [Candidatus Marinamargulisbacteria bacterium SCGC AAA071-K20]|nr:aminopeptidase [Candidatus Marinamargulisbacteria bacterium SCGC AAA071-K20]